MAPAGERVDSDAVASVAPDVEDGGKRLGFGGTSVDSGTFVLSPELRRILEEQQRRFPVVDTSAIAAQVEVAPVTDLKVMAPLIREAMRNIDVGTVPTVKETKVGFTSALKHFGSILLKGLHIAEQVDAVALPYLKIALPAVGNLNQMILSAAINIEAAGQAAAASGGNGKQKLTAVVAAVTPMIESQLGALGIVMNADQINKYVDAVVASINLIPAPSMPTAVPVPAADAKDAQIAGLQAQIAALTAARAVPVPAV